MRHARHLGRRVAPTFRNEINMSRIATLKAERRSAWNEAKSILDLAVAEKRELTTAEKTNYDRINVKLTAMGDEIEHLEGEEARAASFGQLMTQIGGSVERPEDLQGRPTDVAGLKEFGTRLSRNDSFAGFMESRSAFNPKDRNLDFGKMLRGAVTGKWDGANEEQRSVVEGANSAGGFLVPSPLSASIIDKARNQARVIQAGAVTVPMSSLTQRVPRLSADPAVSWRAEGAAVTPTDPTFEQIMFTAQSLIAVTQISYEALEDGQATNLGAVVQQSIAKAIALEIDRVCLRGTGSSNIPKGVLHQSGVSIVGGGTDGSSPDWDDISAMATRLRTSNFEPNALIWAPRTEGFLSTLKADGSGVYMTPPATLDGIARLASGQVPINLTTGSSSDTSEIYMADWSNLLIGVRHDISIRFLTEAFSANGLIGVEAQLRMDVQLAHPAAFEVLNGVRAV